MEKKLKLIIPWKNSPGVRKMLLYMRLTLVISLVAVLQTWAVVSYSQTTTLSINLKNATVQTVLQQVEDQSEFYFLYSRSLIDVDRTVDLQLKNAKITEVLNTLFSGTDVAYKVDGRQIVLSKKSENSAFGMQQQKSVFGKVTDSSGGTLPGVSVVVKGTTTGTISDTNGGYSVPNIPENATLQFSFVGMKTLDVKVSGKSSINVIMVEDAIGIEEVVAVGYGTMKKSDLTGSIASVNREDLQKNAVTTPDQALQGRVAGVQVRTDSHAPGGSISVQVRGTASLSASGQPLYVVDGFPISNEFMSVSSANNGIGSSTPNPLNSIDPSNIESIEILKDASATAIYGSRATNGVVLITTKRGKSGKANIDFESSFSIEQPAKYFDMLGAKDWAVLMNESNDELGQKHTFTDDQVAAMGAGTDWQREVFQSAMSQKYKLSVSGGTPDIHYLISGNYSDQDGIVKSTNFKRYSTNVNLDANVTKNFSVGSSLMFTSSQEGLVPNDSKGYSTQPSIMANIFQMRPNMPVRDGNGDLAFAGDYAGGQAAYDNPVYMTENYDINTNTTRILGSIFANYKILKGLEFKVRLGLDYRDWKYKSYYPIRSQVGKSVNGVASLLSEKTQNILNENILEYKTTVAEKHQVSVMAGFTNQTEKDEYLSGVGYGFPSDFYKYNNLGLATQQYSGTGKSKWALLSYIGRINYTFNNKYLLTATARYDGSSKFGVNNKYGFFPSFAGAWRMTEERFIKDLNVFSNLKLRAGWGSTGNERIGVYNSISTITTEKSFNSGYIFGGVLGAVAYPRNISNKDLSWEKSQDVNLGMDIGFFDNRVNLTMDIYKKRTSDLLINVPLATESGYTSVLKNTGVIENKGFELNLQTVNIKSPFTWTTNLSFSMNRNKVIDLGGATQMFAGWVGGASNSLNGGNVARMAPGMPVGAFYGVVAEGIWKSAEEIASVGTMKAAKPGDMRFKDVNKDGTFNSNDCQYIGDPNPDFTFGFNNDFSYKQWSLGVYTYGEIGQDVAFMNKVFLAGGTGQWAPDRNARWSPSNTNGTTVRAASGYPGYLSTDNVYNASFVRVKNIVLNYSLPVRKMNIKWMSSAKVSVAVDNPFIFTKYPGYDPEVNSFGTNNAVKGVDLFAYPASKALRVGLNVSF